MYFFVAAGNSFHIQMAIAPPITANGITKIGSHCQPSRVIKNPRLMDWMPLPT